MELVLVFCLLCAPLVALIIYAAVEDTKRQKMMFASQKEMIQREVNWSMAIRLYDLARASGLPEHKRAADNYMMKHVWGVDASALQQKDTE